MDTREELKDNKRKFENGEINENEYNERQELILNKLLGKSKKRKPSHVVDKPKETDLYAVLELKPNATEAEIKSKYRKLALKNHPDKNGGVETENWNAISNAYQILSDKDKRFFYDNHGTINDSLEGKLSFNSYVGGDSWRSYIGDIEVGSWLFSFMDNKSSPESSTAEQKQLHDANRVSKIAHFLQDKLSRFPKQDDDPSELESFKENLRQDAQKLYVEPSGKELLLFLGEIYVSKANAHIKNYSIAAVSNKFSGLFNRIGFTADLVSGLFVARTKGPLNQEEISKLFWRLSRSEISLIAQKACEEVLNNKNQSADKSQSESNENHLANSLRLLGQMWLELGSKQKI